MWVFFYIARIRNRPTHVHKRLNRGVLLINTAHRVSLYTFFPPLEQIDHVEDCSSYLDENSIFIHEEDHGNFLYV